MVKIIVTVAALKKKLLKRIFFSQTIKKLRVWTSAYYNNIIKQNKQKLTKISNQA